MASKIITDIYNSLPKNKKSEEFKEFFHKLRYITFTEEEYDKFVEDMKVLVEFANRKYPRTTPYFFRKNPGNTSVSVVVEGKVDSISATPCPIGESYSNLK